MAKEKVAAEADWQAYYASIKPVCPWAYRAYMEDKILTVTFAETEFRTWALFLQYTEFDCVVFICENKSPEWLETKCDQLNAEQDIYEWLWSHPDKGGDSTPVPVLIQQERALLEDLRTKTGYYDD